MINEVDSLSTITLSIICPIHKMEGKLSNIKSWVREATEYGNIQVILIHDEGDDQTGIELEEFLTTLDRKPILQTGRFGSPGGARNQGMKHAIGQWTIFWDSDDVPILSETLKLIQKSRESDQVLIGQYQEILYRRAGKERSVTKADNYFSLSTNLGMWRMIFRSEILKHKEFPELSMAEDLSFLVAMNMSPKYMRYFHEIIYNYVKGFPNQLSSSKKFQSHNQLALYWVLKDFNSRKESLSSFTLSLLSRIVLIRFPYQLKSRHTLQELTKLFSSRPHYAILICWYCLRHITARILIKFRQKLMREN